MNDATYPYYVPQFGVGQTPDPYPGTGFDKYGKPNLAARGGEGGTTNFNLLQNRPTYAGKEMTGETQIPTVPAKVSDLSDGAALSTTVSDHTNELATMNTMVAEVQKDADDALSDIATIQADVTELTGRVSTLETTIGDINTRLVALDTGTGVNNNTEEEA